MFPVLNYILKYYLAAYFVQTVVANFERHYEKFKEGNRPATDDSVELGKECSNLLVLISDLYNYRVISCTLVYDIIRLILEDRISELDVELILKLAKGMMV